MLQQLVEVGKLAVAPQRTVELLASHAHHNRVQHHELPLVTQPTCLIWGKNDVITPDDVAEDFHRLLPDSDLFWIDKCGHAPMLEHPNTFNEILAGWHEQRGVIPAADGGRRL